MLIYDRQAYEELRDSILFILNAITPGSKHDATNAKNNTAINNTNNIRLL